MQCAACRMALMYNAQWHKASGSEWSMDSLWHRLFIGARFLFLFLRLPLLGFTLMLPLVGALGSKAHPAPDQAVGLLLAGLAFHCFAYVLNDVIDLPLDRTESLRADYPLVRNQISRRAALAFALAQLPIAVILTALLGGGTVAYGALAVAYGLIAVYNLYGKRTPFPPLIDFVQGIGWAAMVTYGAAITGSPLAPVALVCAIFVLLYITMLNGIHGGLRDLENDLRGGARTTAIFFGARPDGHGGASITPVLAIYTIALQLLISVVMLVPLYANWYGYDAGAWQLTAALATLLVAASVVLLAVSWRQLHDRWAMLFAGSWHLLLLLTGLVALVALQARPWMLTILVLTHMLPLFVNGWLYRSVAHWIRALVFRKGVSDGSRGAGQARARAGADHAD
jgi:4-hydroxybenzoate polyprenyltransferase